MSKLPQYGTRKGALAMRQLLSAAVGAILLSVPLAANGQTPSSPPSEITGVTAGFGLAGGGTVGNVRLSETVSTNPQIATSYTLLAADRSKLVTFENLAAVAVSVPTASSAGFDTGYSVQLMNRGAGTVTLTPASGTIGGQTTLALTSGEGVQLVADSANWQVNALPSSGGGGGAVSSVTGTTNEITAAPTIGAVVLSIPDPFIAPGSIAATTSVSGPNFLLNDSASHEFILGQSAPMAVWNSAGGSPTLQILTQGIGAGVARFTSISGNNGGSTFLFNRSGSDSIGVLVGLASGDRIGTINFRSANVSSWMQSAQLTITVSGTPPTTGTFSPGNIELQTSNGNTSPGTGIFIGPNQEVVINPNTTLSTSASVGFFYLPKVAGTPSGVPADYSNNSPLVLDATNKVLYFYQGGWNAVTGGGAGGGINAVNGTSNQINATTAASIATLSLPNSVQFPGTLSSSGISSSGVIQATGVISGASQILAQGKPVLTGDAITSVVGTVNQLNATQSVSQVTLVFPTSIQVATLSASAGISAGTSISGTSFIPGVNVTTPAFGFFSPAPNELALSVTSSQQFRIESSGILLANITQAVSRGSGAAGTTAQFPQFVNAAGSKQNEFFMRYNSLAVQGGSIGLYHSKSDTIGAASATTTSDILGTISLGGVDSTGIVTTGAVIRSVQPAVGSLGLVPATIELSTSGQQTGIGVARAMLIDEKQNVLIANSGQTALSTSASNGFLWISSTAGTPTGTPSNQNTAGNTPIVADVTNNILYFYSNAAWHSTSGSGVSSVSGTVNQINSTGGTTPVLSFPNSVQFPGTESSTGISSTGIIQAASTISGTAFIPAVLTTTPAFGFFSPAPNQVALSVTSSQQFRIDDSGRVLINTTVAVSSGNQGLTAQSNVSTLTKIAENLTSYAGPSGGQTPILQLQRSRSGVIGVNTGVALSDQVGQVRFQGVDSVGVFNNAGVIGVSVAASPTSGAVPGLMSFTTTDGTGTGNVHLNVDFNGNVYVGAAVPAALSTTVSNGFLWITTTAGTPTGTPNAVGNVSPINVDSTNNLFYFYSGGAWRTPSGSGASLSVQNTWTAGQAGRVSDLTDAATVSIDFATGNNFRWVMAASRTLANPSNVISGQSGIIAVTQSGSGGSITFGSSYVSTTKPNLTTTVSSATDYLTYYAETPTRIYVSVINNVK